jgi:hypothetical protein
MMHRPLSPLLVLLLALGCGATEPGSPEGLEGSRSQPLVAPVVVRTVIGDDWELPPTWGAHPHSGIYGAGPTVLNDVATIMMPMIPWKEMHKGDGQYDWSQVDAQLAKAPIVLRMWCGSPGQVPGFVLSRHPGWTTFVNSEGGVELPQWSSGWLDEWKVFVAALGARYKNNPNFRGFQLQVTADGEAFMSPADVADFEALGMTPSLLQTFFESYYEHAVAAFSGQEWKVFSVMKPLFFNSGTRFTREAYATAVRAATLPALRLGMGIRGSGFSERYHFPADWSEWSEFQAGQVVTHDDTFQPLIQQAHVDGQLENWYGPNQAPDITTTDPSKLRYAIRLSLLRGLADQYSFIWLDGNDADFVEEEYPNLVHYVQKVLGRRPAGSPDALVTLGNWPYNSSITTQAWPRWLTPLNLGATGNGVAVDVSGLGFFPNLPQHLGRTVSTTLDLAVDNRFLAPGGPHDVEVLVQYLDNGARWHLDYDSTSGVRSAPVVGGTTSGEWKTVTVRLPDAAFSGRLAGGADLRVIRDSGTVTVQVVRVVK